MACPASASATWVSHVKRLLFDLALETQCLWAGHSSNELFGQSANPFYMNLQGPLSNFSRRRWLCMEHHGRLKHKLKRETFFFSHGFHILEDPGRSRKVCKKCLSGLLSPRFMHFFLLASPFLQVGDDGDASRDELTTSNCCPKTNAGFA